MDTTERLHFHFSPSSRGSLLLGESLRSCAVPVLGLPARGVHPTTLWLCVSSRPRHLTEVSSLVQHRLLGIWASVGEGNGTPLQYSCLENPMDGGAWGTAVHGVAKSWTRLSDFTLTFHFHALEKEMATHSSVLAWRIPGTGKPGGLLPMGSHRVGHD